jgi:uncharacterized protein (TIGR02391 family)
MPPNYRLISVQVGDALKWTASLKEIERVATALFRFRRESFPNDAITSQRAQLIHDWILTLAKQRMENSERDALLVKFVTEISPEAQLDAALKVLSDNEVSFSHREQLDLLLSRGLHPTILRHCRKLFLQSNYFHAVFEAAKAYNADVKIKSNSTKDGEALMLDVWAPEKGVLKVTQCVSETDKNVQDGIKFLGAGLMRAIRNPTAHEPALDWPISKEDCLDILSFITFLYRQLDKAVYFPKN